MISYSVNTTKSCRKSLKSEGTLLLDPYQQNKCPNYMSSFISCSYSCLLLYTHTQRVCSVQILPVCYWEEQHPPTWPMRGSVTTLSGYHVQFKATHDTCNATYNEVHAWEAQKTELTIKIATPQDNTPCWRYHLTRQAFTRSSSGPQR